MQQIADRSTNPYTVGIENTYVTLELMIPALLAVLVQWGLVRRRWLRAAGERGSDALALGHDRAWRGLVILNPIGLAVVAHDAANAPGPTACGSIFATVTAAVAGVLVVMASIECYIRGRILRRRQAASRAQRSRRAQRGQRTS